MLKRIYIAQFYEGVIHHSPNLSTSYLMIKILEWIMFGGQVASFEKPG